MTERFIIRRYRCMRVAQIGLKIPNAAVVMAYSRWTSTTYLGKEISKLVARHFQGDDDAFSETHTVRFFAVGKRVGYWVCSAIRPGFHAEN